MRQGSGLLAKAGWPETDYEAYLRAMQEVLLHNRALLTGLPFPKTRRIVSLNNQPATLPGWAVLEVE
jgi:CRISPR-associated protein Csm5